ncbi:ImmA/IrrE family metallo-endopeptidase [Paenibacillus aestuarii]|uniref:ImmA/IrrE family metallo-endopeptidase n=1 Tax=Paenibacillus aestuarii TaxID=516965 RepID=A0ABW0KCJ8_9BACL|nr:ImmA/IrrE family metallo-endopeptidase [Paenibacillus aestuarii]
MFSAYQLTPLEAWIERLYTQHGITAPEHLTISHLSAKLGIWTYYMDMNSMAVEHEGKVSINVDRRLSAREQWEDFLHEVCHVLRHSGNQMIMPEPYTDWQEQDAAAFQLYAALPFSMIRHLSLPERTSEMIEVLSEEFQVTYKLAKVRLEQIQRRVLQGMLDQKYHLHLQSPFPRSAPAPWSAATRAIMDKLDYLQKQRSL